ncbi:hypothetical protein Tco_0498402, partial [Tanacetum coccineum]
NGPSCQPQDDISKKDVQETSSLTDSTSVAEKDNDSEQTHGETRTEVPKVNNEQGDEASTKMGLEEKTRDIDEDQAGSDLGKSHEAPAGSNPETMHEDFYATVYPDIQRNLKLRTNEHVV